MGALGPLPTPAVASRRVREGDGTALLLSLGPDERSATLSSWRDIGATSEGSGIYHLRSWRRRLGFISIRGDFLSIRRDGATKNNAYCN
uniref:Uncharacterized protein n=1 Tax=Hyaloperonospora arabidopsidis (strain Emoy2) TaxID=559515 RepID=M4BGR4_HYAAE